MKRPWPRLTMIALAGLVIGVCFYYLTDLELEYGLDNLFKARGKRTPPSDVVIVVLDEQSEKDLGLSWKDYSLWRKFHAETVQRLHQLGAKLIVFDLQFIQPQPEIDPDFAKAIEAAGNVLITQCVEKITYWPTGEILLKQHSGREQCSHIKGNQLDSTGDKADKVKEPRMIRNPPLAVIGNASLDRAPFYLANDNVREAWTFIDHFDDNLQPNKQIPTLPVLAWFHYLARSGKWSFTNNPPYRLSTELSGRRNYCLEFGQHYKDSTKPSDNAIAELFDALLCSTEDTRYLDFYGPPQTFPLVSYSEVYHGKSTDFKDKVVFIGKANKDSISGTVTDVFPMPFTANETGKMFGVEIMATQFANLLENREIRLPVPPLLILLAISFIGTLVFAYQPGIRGMAIVLCLGGAYLGFALWSFSRFGWWLPIIIPTMQLLMILFISLLCARKQLLADRKRLTDFIGQVFPEWLSKIPSESGGWGTETLNSTLNQNRDVSGVCLSTDIEGYTQVAGRLPPRQLWNLLETYYRMIGKPVSANKGMIANVQGDAMMAFWIDGDFSQKCNAACQAALDIIESINHFNDQGNYPLPTRIGLYAGDFVLGSGEAGNFRYFNPFGNTLNTASRIEGVNKYLGTRILATEGIVKAAPQLMYRPVGAFLLIGLQEPVELVEILGNPVKPQAQPMFALFKRGLAFVRLGDWQQATVIFQQILAEYGEDGPSQFYFNLALNHIEQPPADWEGYVILTGK
jgi:adenylate cyclase